MFTFKKDASFMATQVKTPSKPNVKPETVVETDVQLTNQPATTAPTQPQAEAKPAAQPQPTAELNPQFKKPEGFAGVVFDIRNSGTDMQKTVVERLSTYAEDMAPGKMLSDAAIVQYQLQLWSTLRAVVESEADFDQCFPLVVAFFKEGKDAAFSDRCVYRGAENIPLDKDTLAVFQNLINAIRAVVDRGSYQEATKIVDINRSIREGIFSDEGRNRLIALFS